MAGLQASLQQSELEAERLQQHMLHTNACREIHGALDEGEGRQHTVSNLVLYLTQVGRQPDTVRMADVLELVDALFDSLGQNV